MRSPSFVVTLALELAAVSLLAAVASGFGHRWSLWGYATGFQILRWAVIGAGVSVACALIGAFMAWRNGNKSALYGSVAALVLGLVTALPPLLWLWTARQLPLIHDISTDTENPPAFVAILPARANAPNTAAYGGPEIAQRQKEAYPDVKSMRLRIPPPQVFAVALETARDLGWKIVESNAAAGRIEASDRTFWYGFIDDVVIRVTPLPDNGSRIDVRSVSRVGLSDVGTNARRIRNFLNNVSSRMGSADAR